MDREKVLIIGGGNIGTTLACYAKHFNPELEVRLYVRDATRFAHTVRLHDVEQADSFEVTLDMVSDDASIAVRDAGVIFVALPHFAVQKAFANICPYISEGALIGVVPGSGGCEFTFDRYFRTKARLFGFQRVPFVARVVNYGCEANLLSWKPFNVIGALRRSDLESACNAVEACGLKTKKAENYLAVSLAPSNPIIHTACIYGLFHDYTVNHEFSRAKRLYEEWDDVDSETMISMDNELHALFKRIPNLDMSCVRPLTEHYESLNAIDLTQKIRSISSFKNLLAPMIQRTKGGGYFANTKSRMFTEDFPFGLAIIRAHCEIFGADAPTIDHVLGWYADWLGLDYYRDGRFCGSDLASTGIPQNYGIRRPDQIIEFYQR